MEVVQTGPLVCASRPSSSHPPPHARLSHADPTSALHVHTEEGGGGLDPSWWKISASGSWDGGERRMRYGKIIDDRSGSIPGAIQRRKLEMLETHAPGASMRVVHSQSHASWVQDPSDSNSSGMSTSISSSRRSVLSSSSSSTRVTSFRQWSSNFTQNSTNNVGVTQETRPTVTEFGNLKLALNPLDVSFLRTKGNVGRSGSIGSRRPPSRGRRLSTDVPSDSSAGEEHSKTPSPIPKGEGIVRAHDIAQENRTEKSEENSQEAIESRSEWTPSSSKTNLEADEKSKFALRLQTVLHRKRSVSSEDVRTGEGTDEEDASPVDTEGKWKRGASVRRSLPSSEWKTVVAAADETRQRLRPRDPFKSSSVPALGGISSRRESFVTAESLREMKGRLKHRGSATDSIGGSTTSDIPPKNGETTQRDDDDSTKPGSTSFFLRVASKEAIPGTKQLQEAQDDRRKSWSVGCRNFAKRSFEEENEGMLNRRRSYAFEFAAEENDSTEDKENTTVGRTLQDGRGDAQREKLWVDTHPYVQNRVNEVLKKWSVIGKEEETKGKEELSRTSEKSPMASKRVFEERKGDSPVKSSTTWLENGDFQTDIAEIEEVEFSQATTTCGGRTSFRVNTSKSPFYKDEMISSTKEKQESSFSISGEPMEEYMSVHGLRPIDWTDEDAKASNEPEKNEVVPATAGISVTFSNTDGENNSRHHYSVTHLDSREAETMKTEGSKVRSSKKVEFSKTEVHFAAESGRFHIVETAGKPPPSNNFRRRRRSPTGAMNVDSGRVGLGSQSAITNGMRFGDSPYEMRLLAGSESLEHSFRNSEDEFANGEVEREENRVDGEGSLEYKLLPSSHTKSFNELVIEDERDLKEGIRKISETETLTSNSTTFLHLGSEEQSEKPRSILRTSLAENVPPWKITVKGSDDSENEDSKPKFGGVRLRPVASSLGHLRVNVTNNDSQEQLNASSTDKEYPCALSPGQMELQKLLRSLRRVSMTYSDSPTDSNTAVAQVANGGGMEVRISSASSQPSGTNTVIIGGDSSEVNAPLSVAQRVREVEERRQKEMINKIAAIQKPAPRASGQFSTRVTLGSTSSSVVSMESQVQRKTSVSQIENSNPVSPKPAEKLSTQNNKIARIHNAQDKVGQLQVVRKGIREEIRRQERTQYRATSEEGALKPEPTVITPIIPLLGGRKALSPTSIRVEQPFHHHKDWKKTSSEPEGLWRGNWPNPTPSASWPSARGFGRVGDDRVMLKSPSLILQTMLNSAFSTPDKDKSTSRVPRVWEVCKETEVKVEVDKVRVETIAGESHSETFMSGDKLQPKLSILRALYRDASEEEGSDAPIYEEIKPLDGFQRTGGLRVGDGGSVVSGSWRRLRRSKQPAKRAAEESATCTSVPKPVPRRQTGQAVARTKQRPSTTVEEPPMPPPRSRNNAQRVKRRSDGRGGGGGGGGERKERVQEKKRREGSGRGGECGGKGITSRLSGDGQQHSQVAATSDIKISARMTENHTKLDQSKEVPMVTCISLGFQNKLKDGLKHAETRDEAKDKSDPSKISGSKIDGLSAENPKRITTKVTERKVEGREKSPEVALHSRTEKYCVSSSSKDINTAWHRVNLKNKEQDDHAKMDTSVQDIRSPKRGKELSLDIKEKPNAKPSIESLGSPIAMNKSFQSDATSFQRFKDESRVDDIGGQFSVKMKVVKNQVEENSGAISDPVFQSNLKSSTQSEYLHQRKTTTLTTSSKFTENESNAQRSKKESSPRVSREPRALAMQASKSPVMEQKSKVLTRSSKSGNPETSSPSSGRVMRKRLRKRGSGSTTKSLSSSNGRKQSIDDESAILEELTKAADEILHAVNGYSDEASSDEDVEASKSESRTKRRQVSRKEVCSRKLSSSSSKDPKGGGSLRNSSLRIKESRSRVTNGATSPSAEVMQRIVPEPQTSGTEVSKNSHRRNSSPISSPNLHARSSSKVVLSEKSSKSKQHSPLPIPKKSMTRIEPTNRVAEVKLIEKRPPLPPAGQRRPSGTKERSEVLVRGSHGKVKTTTSLVYNKDGEAEIIKEAKRPLNIARALEAVMPESRTKTKKIDQKVEVSSALKVSEIQKRVNPTSTSSSAQSSPSATLSMDRKKVASSRDGDKTSRRRAHQNITST